ncbi:MAG: hypothetical protein JRN02_06500 [Nitrososphaerota archaeon]|nr:hypothetical protein [Nitrososphaerota archaeon]
MSIDYRQYTVQFHELIVSLNEGTITDHIIFLKIPKMRLNRITSHRQFISLNKSFISLMQYTRRQFERYDKMEV